MLFDTHAHYDDERFDEDRDTLLASMPENNVGLILNPGCDVESSRKAVSYANKYPFVYAAAHWHRTKARFAPSAKLVLTITGKKTSVRVRGSRLYLPAKWSWRVHCTSLSSCMTAMRTPTAWRSPVGIRM